MKEEGNVRVGLKWCGWSGGVVWRMVRMVGCVGSAAREGEVLSVK